MTNNKGKKTDLELEVCNKENLDHLNMENAYEEKDAKFLCLKDETAITLQSLQQVKENRKAIELKFTKCDQSKLEDG